MKKSLLFILLCLPGIGFSQYLYTTAPFFSYFKDLERYEIAGNGSVMLGQFYGSTPIIDANKGTFSGDTTIKRSMVSPGFGGSIGLSIPISRIGHISMAAITVHLMFNSYSWQDLNEEYSTGGSFKPVKPSLTATTTTLSLPVSFDYKIGCDAICTKRLTFGATVGGGLMPEYSMTALDKAQGFSSQGNFTASPFFKLEGAVFAGICVKLRVQVAYGDLNLLSIKTAVPGATDGPFTITGGANIIASLVFMPFSVRWGETGWWNTHDTYMPYDKLN